MSHRYKFTLAYHGHGFSGFQTQPGRDTVQSALEAALKRVLAEDVKIVPSGRTDTGVHALAQVFHADIKTEKALERIEKRDFLLKLNSVLPDTLAISAYKRIPDFHARKSAKKKTYEYIILNSRFQNPFLEDKVCRIGVSLDLELMEKAAKFLLGKHDFSAFCASDSTAKDKVRKILNIEFSTRSPAPFFALAHEKYIRIRFTGAGFLKQMVRNLVGTLLQVGHGKIPPTRVKEILESRDRKQAGMTAPAQGLYLVEVDYE